MSATGDARAQALAAEPLRLAGPTLGYVQSTRSVIKDLFAHRELLDLLIRREIKARYKDSALGVMWTLIRPLVMLVIYFVAVGKFLHAGDTIPQYAVYIFSGLTAWGLFADLVTSGTASIVTNGGLVKKVYLPREIFPLSTTGSSLFNFAVQLSILIAAAAIAGLPSIGNLAYFPLSFAVLLSFGLALALTLSAANVYLRDVQYLVEVALMVLFWASPVIYPWTAVQNVAPGWVTDLYLANPATLAVLGFQRAFWSAGASNPLPSDFTARLWISLAVCLVLVWVSQRLFSRLQGNFAQEL